MQVASPRWNRQDSSPRIFPSRLQQMARFRNLLVHVYWKIDYGQVYDVITTRLEDLRAFRSAMAGLI
ncbi:MAG: DUF86 domain-containing protein [Nitrospira sp. CG24B]|nr:MAG: DUF86 domain-containing protein [Nitrospira sp. CG24B]